MSTEYSLTKKQALGLESQKRGRSFEEKVSELYRLLHYEIENGRLFSGRQVDLFLSGKFGDLVVFRAIECKSGPVTVDHLDKFLNKLNLAKTEYPPVQGTIVSGVSFTDTVVTHAKKLGIQTITYRDLSAQLFDGHLYAQELIKEYESNIQYPLKNYIDQFVYQEAKEHETPAIEYIEAWLADETCNLLTILGDLGTGKTFLTRVLAHKLASDFLKYPLENPCPIRIDLRNADREFSLEGLILNHLAKSGLSQVNFDIFLHSLFEGNIILILDGFDEMASRVSPLVTKRNFHELTRCVSKRSKVLLTCRTHYFKSRTEEEEVILGKKLQYETDAVQDLYWELISRKGYRISYLKPFSLLQIESYVHKVQPKSAKQILRKIRKTYNLIELSQRPLLLDMIVKSINKLSDQDINVATLYRIFTNVWILREEWREVLSPETKLTFLQALSLILWEEDLYRIHHTKLFEYLSKELHDYSYTPQDMVMLDHEIRTASFLNRDEYGNYGFVHKSFAEYFIAMYLASHIQNEDSECLRIRRITPEVVGFLSKMLKCIDAENFFCKILTNDYQKRISENALIALYGIYKENALKGPIDKNETFSISILLPENAKLNHAQLDQLNLEGAVLKNASLINASLSEATLINVDFTETNLSGANLSRTNLENAIFYKSNLTRSNLNSSNLNNSIIEFSRLNNANLDNTRLTNTSILGSDLSGISNEGILITNDDIDAFIRDLGSAELVFEIFGKDTEKKFEETSNFIKLIYPFLRKITKIGSDKNEVNSDDLLGNLVIFIITRPSLINKLKESFNQRESNEFAYIINSLSRHIADSMIASEGHSGVPPDKLAITEADIPSLFDYIESKKFIDVEAELITLDLAKTALSVVKNTLSEDYSRILKARYIDEMKLREIAEMENISISTVHNRIKIAKRILQAKVDEFSI